MPEYDENVDIQCGGVLVRPGDIIVGDDDGVVVVPKQAAEEIVAFAEEYEEVEAHILQMFKPKAYRPVLTTRQVKRSSNSIAEKDAANRSAVMLRHYRKTD